MSDALSYLMQVRPQAMKSYFDFIKQSGTHLDPRTRALISVITKVDHQTETGFRQYLVRALQAGVTANQIIDALLVSFPILGLSKIIWAIDIILVMDIPEFRLESLVQHAVWHELVPLGQINDGCFQADCEGRKVFVFRHGDEIRVYDSICPHQATHIPAAALSGNSLVCPRHHWKFDITTGECVEHGNRPLRRFETRIENQILFAMW